MVCEVTVPCLVVWVVQTARLQQVMSQAGEEQEAEARRRRKEQEVEEAAEDEAGEDAVRDLRNMEMTQQAENEAYRRHLDSTPTKSPANVRRGPGGSASGGKKRGRAGSPRREAEELLLQSESRRPRLSQEEGTASSGTACWQAYWRDGVCVEGGDSVCALTSATSCAAAAAAAACFCRQSDRWVSEQWRAWLPASQHGGLGGLALQQQQHRHTAHTAAPRAAIGRRPSLAAGL